MSDQDYLSNLKAGKKVMEKIEDSLGNKYNIDGKTPNQWQKHFHITVPKNATTSDVKDANARLATLFNDAAFYLANAQLISDAIAQGSRDKYIHQFENKVNEWKQSDRRLPSQKTLDTLAEAGMMELNGAKANADMKLRFWKHIINGLSEQRKSLEQIMWMLREELRTEMNR
jgi:hypothetical protein